jgi:nucleolin
MGVAEAQKSVEQARAAYNANKDKALKKALKAAKATLAAEEAKQLEVPKNSKKRKGEEPPVAAPAVPAEKPKKQKKAKRTQSEKDTAQVIEGLRTAVVNAKTAYRADKTIDNKQKLKAAKAAVKAAEAGNTAVPSTPVSTPAAPPATPTDVLAGLKSNKHQDAAEGTDKKRAPMYDEPCNRVFVANLSWDIEDDGIKQFFEDCGEITKIAWIEDKETKRFKGCGVLDFESVEGATKAVAKNNEALLGRPVVVQYSRAQAQGHDNSKPRGTGNPPVDEKQAKFLAAPLAPKPDGCVTCFVGNLSFSIEEDDVRQLAEDCGEITSIRWVHHKDSGDFKGCGFVDFADTEAVDKFIAKRGSILKGRPIRIDYSESRKKF